MVTLQVIVEALELDDHRPDDDRTTKKWIKDHKIETDIKAMGEALRPGEAKRVRKKDMF